MSDHEGQKQQYQAFRRAAQRAVATNRFPETAEGMRIHIEAQAAVAVVEDGAFVEAVIWVPTTARRREDE